MGRSASPSRWSRPACPNHSPSSRDLLNLPASHGHLSRPAPLRSVPWLAKFSSESSPSSQLSSARLSLSLLLANQRCPPSPSDLKGKQNHAYSNSALKLTLKIQNFT